jgi:hypothetical protein
MVAGIPKHLLYYIMFGLYIPLYPPLCVVYPLVNKKRGEVENPPCIDDDPSYKLPFGSGSFQLAMLDYQVPAEEVWGSGSGRVSLGQPLQPMNEMGMKQPKKDTCYTVHTRVICFTVLYHFFLTLAL